MGTILDYLEEYGEYSFEQKPMNEVDSLVLSQLAYLKFDGLVPEASENAAAVTIGYVNEHQDRDKLFADERYREPNTQLFDKMVRSVRFGSLRLKDYVNIIEEKNETQFCAITYMLKDDMAYICYRGTDETIVGWKEDFNLAFSKPVPGQLRSVEYLNRAAGSFDGMLCVGGHSKGGNFAVYAAMNCSSEVQERIWKIYNHDGPGFRPEIRDEGKYERIAGRVVKIIPHSSLVGMLLESHAEGYMVVESKSFGLLQHNPYTWLVREDQFVQADGIYKSSRLRDEALNEWILSLDEEHIRSFVDTLYEVVAASQAQTVLDFGADWKKSMAAVITAYKELDEETVVMLRQIMQSLFEHLRGRAMEELQERAAEGLTKIEGLQEKAAEAGLKKLHKGRHRERK